MFRIFRSKPSEPTLPFPLETDMHCHLLPGIDDGAPDLQTSIELIEGMISLGIRSAVATPHIISDVYPNTPETISTAYQLLSNEIEARGIQFKLKFAAEYQMDEVFFEKIKNGEKLLTVRDNILLAEFSFASAPFNMEEMAFAIITAGYTPILAHPERYGYFHQQPQIYHRLHELGFKLQPNLLSITGYYGNAVTRATQYLIKNNLVSYLGTDLHHHRGLQALKDSARLIGSSYADTNYNEGLNF